MHLEGSCHCGRIGFSVEADSPVLDHLQQIWARHLLNAIEELPAVSTAEVAPEVRSTP